MRIKKSIIAVLSIVAIMSTMVCSAFAATPRTRTNFNFWLKGNDSQSSLGGWGTKSDSDAAAYVQPTPSDSNLTSANATVNLRVRTADDEPASNLTQVSSYPTTYWYLYYFDGSNIAGRNYKLYANVESASVYPVYIRGIWIP